MPDTTKLVSNFLFHPTLALCVILTLKEFILILLQLNAMGRPRQAVTIFTCGGCSANLRERTTFAPAPSLQGGRISYSLCASCFEVNTNVQNQVFFRLQANTFPGF